METFIVTTFVIIISFSIVNLLTSLFLYLSSKRTLYFRSSLFWLTLIINFIIQSQSQSNEFWIIMGFGFTIVPLNFLSYTSMFFCNRTYPKKIFIPLGALSLVVTLALQNAPFSFTLKAMPFALTGAIPLFYTVYLFLFDRRSQKTRLMYVHAALLFALAIHSLNFAFFRMVPNAQFWGWPIAYGLYQLLAVLIPALTLDFYHTEEQNRLREIIDLKTKDLTAVNNELRKAIQQEDYLFRTLTHDISNPLSAMKYQLEDAVETGVSKESLVATLSEMVRRTESLIHQVVLFSNIDKSTFSIEVSEINLAHCLKSVEGLFEGRLRNKGLTFIYNKEAVASCTVFVDPDSFINSVVSNIMSNAIKFSFPGGKITLDVRVEGSDFLILSFKDEGLGMPKATLDKLFEFESNQSRKGTSGEVGTGFGIPILAKIIKAYGGNIKILSEEKTETQKGFTIIEIKLLGRMTASLNKVS